MANQSPHRRQVLEMLAKAAAVSQFAGCCRWTFAFGAEKLTPAAEYRPQFYTSAEYQTIDVLTELIIPADESPGARQAGVSEFIDLLAAHGEGELDKPMRKGLAALDAKSEGGRFVKLSPEKQTALLRTIQSDPFFRLMRRYTVMGFYTSRVGLEELDYPGLKMYTQSPECPHTNDPEHRHLSPTKL